MSTDDPVLAKRARIAHLANSAQRVGYLLYGVAIVVFVVGFTAGLSDTIVTIVIVGLVAGSVVLAPAIILGYTVRAAERADRDDDW